MIDIDFYKNKRVFITGHTGFKGSWLCQILLNAGAIITGYSIDVPTNPSLFEVANIKNKINSIKGDIRDFKSLKKAFDEAKPEIVFHLAAQPLVIESYNNPVYTYETNVMGTVNILECVRKSNTVKSFLNITTDKVYKNNERNFGYKENDELDGYDPYSNSKSCSELVTHSYNHSFFTNTDVSISTARAGNVIGGGDFADNRIIPDCIRSVIGNKEIIVRNPNSIRPYQHVLEPLFAYLLIAQKQYNNKEYSGNYNVGPDESDCITTSKLVNLFCEKWGKCISWNTKEYYGPHESNFLKLDCSKLKQTFMWKPTWNVEKAVEKTVKFTKEYTNNKNISKCMDKQINDYIQDNRINI